MLPSCWDFISPGLPHDSYSLPIDHMASSNPLPSTWTLSSLSICSSIIFGADPSATTPWSPYGSFLDDWRPCGYFLGIRSFWQSLLVVPMVLLRFCDVLFIFGCSLDFLVLILPCAHLPSLIFICFMPCGSLFHMLRPLYSLCTLYSAPWML